MTPSGPFRTAFLAALALVFCAFGLLAPVPARSAESEEIVMAARLGNHDRETRFVLELTGKVPYTVAAQSDPDRITLSLPALGWQHSRTTGRSPTGLVSEFRYESAHANKAALVLILRSPARPRSVSFIPPESGHDWRLVIDLEPAGKAEFQRVAAADAAASAAAAPAKEAPKAGATPKSAPPATVASAAPPPPKPDKPPISEEPAKTAPLPAGPPAAGKTAPAGVVKPDVKTASPEPPPGAPAGPKPAVMAQAPVLVPPPPRPNLLLPKPAPPSADHPAQSPHRPVIVIDPGHGGADPGAQAADGTKEKDVVLNVALALAKKLEKSGRYNVVLTRTTDATLRLHERVEISRAAHGDLLISLHANLFDKSPNVSGLSVYTLSDKASDATAAALARTENRADILAGMDLSHEDDDVTHILIDLAQHETLNRSVQFAHRLAESVAATTPLEKNAAQQASLVVLKAPDVPSILVELGYLTNAGDLERMKSDGWIDQFADSVIAAADAQFQLKDARRVERAALP